MYLVVPETAGTFGQGMKKGFDIIMTLRRPGNSQPLAEPQQAQKKKRLFLRTLLKDLQPGAALALACCFLVALYGPLELFFTNLEDFKFGFSALFPILLVFFILAFVCCVLLLTMCYLLYQRLYDVVICAGLAVFLSAYVQGMFLSGDLPALDGSTLRWYLYKVQDIQSIILWGLVFFAVLLCARFLHREKMYRLISGLSMFLTAVLLVTGISVGILNGGFSSGPTPIMTTEGQYTMSTEQNLVVLVVDAVDSKDFYDLMETTDPEYRDMLEDFTYYPNTAGAYPFTKYGLPQILHGQWYENQEDYHSFTQRAMTQSPLLEQLRNENYRIGLYEEEADYMGGNVVKDAENLQEIAYEISDPVQLIKEELKLIWFKYAPWPVKKYVNADMEHFSSLVKAPNGVEPFSWRNPHFYESLDTESVETVSDKCFRFIHIEGAHVPFRYNKDVTLTKDGSYQKNIQCAMTVVDSYLQKLKDAGVYDNTAIVILADHGHEYSWTQPLLARCNPFLAVKGIDEHHPLEISEAPISYEDLQEMYRRLLDKQPSSQVFDAQEGDQRDRRVLVYYYRDETKMSEYLQTGHASDPDAMIPTGKEYNK